MKKTIYEVAVPMESKEQCDRMKQLCINNRLPIWSNYFDYWENAFCENNVFGFCENIMEFYIHRFCSLNKTLVTESEFIELLKQEKA